jgi:hypothetical protein
MSSANSQITERNLIVLLFCCPGPPTPCENWCRRRPLPPPLRTPMRRSGLISSSAVPAIFPASLYTSQRPSTCPVVPVPVFGKKFRSSYQSVSREQSVGQTKDLRKMKDEFLQRSVCNDGKVCGRQFEAVCLSWSGDSLAFGVQ